MSDDRTERHAQLAKLREPFAAESISKLPKGKEDPSKRQRCNTCKGYHDPSMFHLDYVGHAAITDRLLAVDPEWTWEPFALDECKLPAMERDNGQPVGLWIRLTVCGMTRPGYGSVARGKQDAVKELIGDALRNAAMRYGCALDLWHKGDLPTGNHDDTPDQARQDEQPASQEPSSQHAKLLRELDEELAVIKSTASDEAKFAAWADQLRDNARHTVEHARNAVEIARNLRGSREQGEISAETLGEVERQLSEIPDNRRTEIDGWRKEQGLDADTEQLTEAQGRKLAAHLQEVFDVPF